MDIIQNVINALGAVAADLTTQQWLAVYSTIGLAGIASVLTQVFKVPIKRFLDRYGADVKKGVAILLTVMSAAVSFSAAYVDSGGQNIGPLEPIAQHFAWIMATAVFIYHIGLNNRYKAFVKFLQDVSTYISSGVLPSRNS